MTIPSDLPPDDPAPTPTRGDLFLTGRTFAALDLLAGIHGIQNVELGYDDDTGCERVPVLWWAKATFRGRSHFSEHYPYPAEAVEDLLHRLGNGGVCRSCGKSILIGVLTPDPDICERLLTCDDPNVPETFRYRRICDHKVKG